MSDNYTESQVNRIEEDAYNGAIFEAGKEWERQRDEFNSREHELQSRIAELEAESERFTVHGDIERQDDKSPNDTQTQTIVYGKESEKNG